MTWSTWWSQIVPVLLGVVLALLSGCTDQRTAGVPAPYQGTWHQIAGVDGSALATPSMGGVQQVGFIAVSADQVLCDIDGLPRGTFGISSISGDAGLGSSMLTLADGRRLFISSGHGSCDVPVQDGRIIGDCSWLDVHVLRTTASGSDESLARMRLWSSGSLAASEHAAAVQQSVRPVGQGLMSTESWATGPAGPSARPTTEHAYLSAGHPAVDLTTGRNDLDFADTVAMTGEQGLVAAARSLTRLHGSGDWDQIASQYHAVVLTVQREMLRLLDQAASGDTVALVEANRRASHLDAFSRAYATWMRTSQ